MKSGRPCCPTACGLLVGFVSFGASIVLEKQFPEIGKGLVLAVQLIGFGMGLVAARVAYPLIRAWDANDGRDDVLQTEVERHDPIPESFADFPAWTGARRRSPTLEEYADALADAATDMSARQAKMFKRRIEKETRDET
jgi:hypothetical protein